MIKNIPLSCVLNLCKTNLRITDENREFSQMGISDFMRYKKNKKMNHGYTCIETDFSITKIGTDYVILKFRNVETDEKSLERMCLLSRENCADIAFSDSKINSIPHLKTDISIDILLQGIEEYDVICMRSELFLMIREVFNKTVFQESSNVMLAAYLITKKFYHIEELLYDTKIPEKKIPALSSTYLDMMIEKEVKKKVSIIIPTKDKIDLLSDCIQSILKNTDYDDYDILIINNRSEEKASLDYFKKIQDEKIRIINADIDFNWSKLNNIGIKNSDADIFVFLNNDTKIIENKWLRSIAFDCSRDDVGIVGGLLLYEDDTIQHAGVVVGMTDFADHLYKGDSKSTGNDYFYGSTIKRNVLAVTGACMAVSRKTLNKIGLFNEDFIICGSDVEICIRSYQNGFNNLYDPDILLYHLESKSRDSYIPPIDFEMSKKYYEPYKTQGDPFFNHSLDTKNTTPTLKRR